MRFTEWRESRSVWKQGGDFPLPKNILVACCDLRYSVNMRVRVYIGVFLFPAVLIYSLVLIFPLFNSLRLSLYTVEGFGGAAVFAGFDNFRRLFGEQFWSTQLWGAFRNNLIFFAIHCVVQNPVGLLLASLLASRRTREHALYRTIFFMPTILSIVIIGFIWRLILSPLWGVAEGMLASVGLADLFQPWLGLEQTALPALSLISVWQFTGIPMMLFYTALIGIPEDLLQAARVDGAGGWRIFWSIKFPLIVPVAGIVTMLTFIGNFNAFDLIYTTQGVLAGPSFSTDILGTFFYRTFFGQQLQLGNPSMGAAIATVMLGVILTGVFIYLIWRRRVKTYEF